MFITDPQHKIKYCNPRYAELLNVRSEEIIGKEITNYLNPEVVKFYLSENEEVLSDMKSSLIIRLPMVIKPPIGYDQIPNPTIEFRTAYWRHHVGYHERKEC